MVQEGNGGNPQGKKLSHLHGANEEDAGDTRKHAGKYDA